MFMTYVILMSIQRIFTIIKIVTICVFDMNNIEFTAYVDV